MKFYAFDKKLYAFPEVTDCKSDLNDIEPLYAALPKHSLSGGCY